MIKNTLLGICAITLLAACGSDDDGAATTFTLEGSNDTSLSLNSTIASQGILGALNTIGSLKATSGINPTELKVKVYKFAVSTDELCASPTTVINNTDPDYVNFYDSDALDLGSASLADGTYPCVMIEMSDNIKFTPAENSTGTASCQADTEYTLDVCRAGSTSQDLDGDTTECDADDNRVTIYISTSSSSSGGGDANAFAPPESDADGSNGIALGAALTKSGATKGLFIVNGDGAIEENGSDCDHQPPTFTFGIEE